MLVLCVCVCVHEVFKHFTHESIFLAPIIIDHMIIKEVGGATKGSVPSVMILCIVYS